MRNKPSDYETMTGEEIELKLKLKAMNELTSQNTVNENLHRLKTLETTRHLQVWHDALVIGQ